MAIVARTRRSIKDMDTQVQGRGGWFVSVQGAQHSGRVRVVRVQGGIKRTSLYRTDSSFVTLTDRQ